MDSKSESKAHPFYIKTTAILLGLVLFIYILNALADIIIPLAIAAMAAILLNPLYNRLQYKLPRVVAIIVSMLVAVLVIGGVLYFLSTQIYLFTKSIPLLKLKFAILLTSLQQWILLHFGLSIESQVQVLKGAINDSQHLLTNTLGTIAGTIGIIILIPIYVFLLLYYKPLILNFLFQVFLEQNYLQVAEVLNQTKTAIQSYMIGLLIETAIVSTLYSIALLIIGVPFAIVVGVIGGILNLLPYLGALIALILSIVAATINTTGFSTQIIIIAVYIFIQFIDNNILVPKIVSSKVQINALISLISILLGSALWGLYGMFLSIPFIAVLKIIFDKIEEMKPWGKLLGDEVPTEHVGVVWKSNLAGIIKRMKKKKIAE